MCNTPLVDVLSIARRGHNGHSGQHGQLSVQAVQGFLADGLRLFRLLVGLTTSSGHDFQSTNLIRDEEEKYSKTDLQMW